MKRFKVTITKNYIFTLAGDVLKPSITTPLLKDVNCSFVKIPGVFTKYTLSIWLLGCIKIFANSPSLVSSKTPVVS